MSAEAQKWLLKANVARAWAARVRSELDFAMHGARGISGEMQALDWLEGWLKRAADEAMARARLEQLKFEQEQKQLALMDLRDARSKEGGSQS